MTQFHRDSARLRLPGRRRGRPDAATVGVQSPPERAPLFLACKHGRGSACRRALRKYKWGANERKCTPRGGGGMIQSRPPEPTPPPAGPPARDAERCQQREKPGEPWVGVTPGGTCLQPSLAEASSSPKRASVLFPATRLRLRFPTGRTNVRL